MVQTDRIDGLTTEVALKAPVKAATTVNITLSGEQTIDGVAITAGDRVLVKDQTDGTENGIYLCQTTAWTRSKDFNGNRDVVQGTRVYIANGTTNGGFEGSVTTADPIVIGTSSISLSLVQYIDPSLPGSSTDNAFPRFDGTDGQQLQNGQTTEDDSGNVTVAGDLTVAGGDLNGTAISSLLDSSDIGSSVQAHDPDTLKADTSDNLTAGFTISSYSIGSTGSGTVTPLISNGNIQHMTVTGSFTLAKPTDTGQGAIEIEATNDGTGGYSPDLSTNFAGISGTYDSTASAVNLFRITKHNSGACYLEIAQEA